MIRIAIVALLVLTMAGPSWAQGGSPGTPAMTLRLNYPTELVASFPNYPTPTDWVKVVKEAYAQAGAMGYVVVYHVPVEYTMYLGVDKVKKTFTGTVPILFLSMNVRPK
jgi:hypothetical protein